MIEQRIKITDLKWSQEGDFEIQNGDLATTANVAGLGFVQEVTERIKSSTGDWTLLPEKGANIDDFKGLMNTEQVRQQIENSITFSLTRDGFLDQQDFEVMAVPVTPTEVAVRLDFDTSLTDVVPDSTIQVKVIYDTDGKGPFIIR